MSKHYADRTENKKLVEQINKGCEMLSNLHLRWNPYEFVQHSVNCQRHPEAILKTLRMVYQQRDIIRNYWTYAVSICQIESKNFYKRDADRQHQIEKNEWIELVNALRKVHGKRNTKKY